MSQPYAAWVMARWLANEDLEGRIRPDDMPGYWREMLGMTFSVNGGDRQAAFDNYLDHRPDIDRASVMGFILAADPQADWTEPPPAPGLYTINPDVPPLPQHCHPTTAQAEAATKVAGWLTDFTQWANMRADRSPWQFNMAGGLFAVSTVIARRLRVVLSHDTYYPNLFMLGVAPTTLYGKTVSLNCAADLLEEAAPYFLLPREMSNEAFLEEMMGKQPNDYESLPEWRRKRWEQSRRFAGQRGQLMDEASSLFTSFTKDYMRGQAEMYLILYDSNRALERRTMQKGLIVVSDPCLSFYGMTTPALFREAGQDRKHWGSGLWIRFSFLTPTDSPKWTPPRKDPNPVPPELVDPIKDLAERKLPLPPPPSERRDPPMTIGFEQDAFDAYLNYDRAMSHELLTGKDRPPEELWGTYGRQSAKAIKIAINLCALDWSGEGKPVITLAHWHRAQGMAEDLRTSMHRLLAWLNRDGRDDEEQRLYNVCEASEKGLSMRELERKTGKDRGFVQTLVTRMVHDGLLEPRESDNSRGPKTVVYVAAARSEEM
jgi:hypothetical protein